MYQPLQLFTISLKILSELQRCFTDWEERRSLPQRVLVLHTEYRSKLKAFIDYSFKYSHRSKRSRV